MINLVMTRGGFFFFFRSYEVSATEEFSLVFLFVSGCSLSIVLK